MKKSLFVLILLGLFMLLAVGCSGEKSDGDTEVDGKNLKKQAMNADTILPVDTTGAKMFPIRNPENPIVTIETDFGNMTLELYQDVAPAHADSFVARTKDGFYNGLTIHRVVKNFMIQGGDPQGNGTGNAGYYLPAEFNQLPHQDGTLSMARAPSPNSASCQFFICLARNRSTEYLDGKYTNFGQLLKGYDVLHQIGEVMVEKSPSGEVSKPVEDIYLRKVYLSDSNGNPL